MVQQKLTIFNRSNSSRRHQSRKTKRRTKKKQTQKQKRTGWEAVSQWGKTKEEQYDSKTEEEARIGCVSCVRGKRNQRARHHTKIMARSGHTHARVIPKNANQKQTGEMRGHWERVRRNSGQSRAQQQVIEGWMGDGMEWKRAKLINMMVEQDHHMKLPRSRRSQPERRR